MPSDVVVAASSAGGAIIAVVVVVIVLGLLVLLASLVVVTEYNRVVQFRFGRVRGGPRGPGLIVRIPIVDRIQRVNLRVEVIDIPSQSVITQDNVTIAVDAVVYFQVVDPVRAVIGVDNFRFASQRIAMTSLRSIIGRYELDSLLAHREDVNAELRAVIARSTTEWGVDVRQVEVRDIQLPPELLRAMARQAEAERERRAKVIAATGELQASVELGEAADRLAASPGALQLRTLQTLAEVATEKNSTLVFPIPVEILEALGVSRTGAAGTREGATGAAPAGGAAVAPAAGPPAVPAPTPPAPAAITRTQPDAGETPVIPPSDPSGGLREPG
jgi:regulator of protease activity HflC (stomatin/prohibitin superfamily)